MIVFYCNEMVADAQQFSPSPAKPRLFVEQLMAHNLGPDLRVPAQVTAQQLYLAHDPMFVDDVLSLRTENGFDTRSPKIAASCLWTAGSLLSAATTAIQERTITCSPTSGFHHAGYDRVGPFCTFNGLMVTAYALKAQKLATRVAIIDCDFHYGDGTDDILGRVSREGILHVTMGKDFGIGRSGQAYLNTLAARCEEVAAFAPDVILYQAGADAHIDDPLGGILRTREMVARDRIVFELGRQFPIAWNLAGGYQQDRAGSIKPVLELHLATYRVAAEMIAKKRGV